MKLKQKIIYSVTSCVGFILIGMPLLTRAATLSARPLTTTVVAGGVFTVSVDLNSQGKTINNAEAVISYPTDLVEVQSVSTGGSIFSLWVEPATFSNGSGTITFNGGAPNPGFSGASGHILSAKFKAKAAGTAQISISSAAIRENDGLGTNVLAGQSGGQISISEQKETTPTPVEQPTPVAPTVSAGDVTITSVTHPDSQIWYKGAKAVFTWKLPRSITASQTSLDKTPGTIPRILRRPAVSTVTVDNVTSGVWYFNARFLSAKGWSPVTAYKIQVDSTSPESVAIIPASVDNQRAVPAIAATDTHSGIDYYLVSIDGAEPAKLPFTQGTTEISLPGISVGAHQVLVQAYDRAGNVAETKGTYEFKERVQLSIVDYSRGIREGGRITVRGRGPNSAPVTITLLTDEGIRRSYDVVSNANGNFTFKSEPIATTGSFEMWATAIRSDGVKAETEHYTITVEKSFGSKFVDVFRAARRLLTPTNIIIVLLALLAALGWMNYFRLRKIIRQTPPKRTSVRTPKILE